VPVGGLFKDQRQVDGWFKSGQTWTVTWDFDTSGIIRKEAKISVVDKNDIELSDPIVIAGEFQGRWYERPVDIIAGESPVAEVVMEVFDLYPGDEVLSYVVRRADGSIEIRDVP
jgi:hypothetical protein